MEVWKDVVDYEGHYRVSTLGVIKSVDRVKICGWGGAQHVYQKVLKASRSRKGYFLVGLSKNGVRTTYSVARIVAKTFLPNPDKKPEVNHKNGIKTDNRIDNLEWATSRENARHAVRTGLRVPVRGSQQGPSKLKEGQVIQIKKEPHTKRAILAHRYGVTIHTIDGIRAGRLWGWLIVEDEKE